jgi:DNA-binding transcriptional ArsR family regulator
MSNPIHFTVDVRSKEKASEELVCFMKVIAEESRFRIIQILYGNSHISVNQLAEILSISQPATSQHLKILKMANIVKINKNGRQILYSLDKQSIRETYGERIDYLAGYFNNKDK